MPRGIDEVRTEVFRKKMTKYRNSGVLCLQLTINRYSKSKMRFIRSLVALSVFAVAIPLAGQGQSDKDPSRGATTIFLRDSLELKPSPELQKSLDELAAAVEALALRIANDPHLRSAALQVATGFVNAAQEIVEQNSSVIQEALKTAADRIAAVETTRRGPTTKRP